MINFIYWFLGIAFALYLVDVLFGHPPDKFDDWVENDFWLEEDPDIDDEDTPELRVMSNE